MWTQKTKPHCKKLHFKKQPHTHAGGLSTLPGERIATEMQQRTLCSTPRQDRVDYGTLAQALVLLFPDSWCVHSKPTSIIVSLVFLSSPQRSEDGGQPRRLQFQNFGANKLTDAELIAEMEMCFSSWSDTRKYVKKNLEGSISSTGQVQSAAGSRNTDRQQAEWKHPVSTANWKRRHVRVCS